MSDYLLCIAAVVIIAAVILCIWKRVDLLHALGSAGVIFIGFFVVLSAILWNLGYFSFGWVIIGINIVSAMVLIGLLLAGRRPHLGYSLRKNAFPLAVGIAVLLAAFLLLHAGYAGTDGFAGKAQTKALWLMYSTQEAGPAEEAILLDSYQGQDLENNRQLLSIADRTARGNSFGLEYLFLLFGRLGGARWMVYGMAVFAALSAYSVSMCFSKKRLMAAVGCLGVLAVLPVSLGTAGAAHRISWESLSVLQEIITPYDAVLLDKTCVDSVYMPVKSGVTSYVLPASAGIEQGNRALERYAQKTGNQIEKTFYITKESLWDIEDASAAGTGIKLIKQLDDIFVYERVPAVKSRENYPAGVYYRHTLSVVSGLLLLFLMCGLLSVRAQKKKRNGPGRRRVGIILLAGGMLALIFTVVWAEWQSYRERETAPYSACLTVRDVLLVDLAVEERFSAELGQVTGSAVIRVQDAGEAEEVSRLRGEHAYYLSEMRPEQLRQVSGLEKTVVRFMNTDEKGLILYQCN